MKHKLIALFVLLFILSFITFSSHSKKQNVIVARSMSLEDRQPNEWVNQVFKDNILLNLAYLRGIIKNPQQIDWNSVEKPFVYQLILKPNETFAFHNDTLPQFTDVAKTTNAHFNAQEGFKSDGYLVGDGVCHLASLIYWAAKDAGLNAYAPTNHNFMPIADIPKEYGVAIYNMPGDTYTNAMQNLYITNNKNKPIAIEFVYNNDKLNVAVAQLN